MSEDRVRSTNKFHDFRLWYQSNASEVALNIEAFMEKYEPGQLELPGTPLKEVLLQQGRRYALRYWFIAVWLQIAPYNGIVYIYKLYIYIVTVSCGELWGISVMLLEVVMLFQSR